MKILKIVAVLGITAITYLAFKPVDDVKPLARIQVSANHRFFMAGGKPFFWLGDTGWLLFSKMNREEAEQYLDTRAKQGFNVIQAMVVHDIKEVNAYGDSALVNKKIDQPKLTEGN